MHDATPQVRAALDGITALSRSVNNRDQKVQQLLRHAKSLSDVVAVRSGQINQLITDGNVLFAELTGRSQAIDQLISGIKALADQLSGFDLTLKSGFHSLGDCENAIAPSGRSLDSYWLANGSWATSHREVVTAFKKALDDANAWMVKNAKTKRLARKMAAVFLGLDPETSKNLPLKQFTTAVTTADVAFWGNLMRTQGGYTGKLDYGNLILQ